WVGNQGEELFDHIRGRFEALFLKKAGEHRDRFRKVPVGSALVKFVPPRKAVLPLSWERCKYWSFSTFHMVCVHPQQGQVVLYSKGTGEADPAAGGPQARLVVEHDQVKIGGAAPVSALKYATLGQLLRGNIFLAAFVPNPQYLTVDPDTAIVRP